MHFKRRLFSLLKKQIHTQEIVVLTGMRQVGKTTLCRMLFNEIESNNKVFLDIENPVEQKIFEEQDFNNIWANLQPYGISKKEKAFLFLDEIQAMPGIVKAIKYLYDHYQVKFFLTGSSSFYLKNLFPESLAGRKIVYELFPLDFEEFLVFKGAEKIFYPTFPEKEKNKNEVVYEKFKKFYDEYLNYGGFPKVVLTDDLEQKKEQLNDLFKSYFEKDVRLITDFREIHAFRDLLFLLMQRVGSRLEISKLASEVGASRQTISSYLSFLEGTYFISLISPFTRNVDREISRTKKIYFCDNGILNHFAKLSEGALFENAIFQNLRKYGKVNYYQRRTGVEIDFILAEKNIALEIKQTGREEDQEKLTRLAKDLKISESYLITKQFSPRTNFIPALEL